MDNKDNYETPIMRDVMKVTRQVLVGILIALCVLFVTIFPLHFTVIGQHCTITSDFSLAEWIYRSLTISC